MPTPHKNAVKNLYSKEKLDEVLAAAVRLPDTQEGHEEFLDFQRTVIMSVLPGFEYEFCSLSTATLSPENEILSLTAVNLNLPDMELMVSYMQNYEYDDLTPLVYANPGRALSYTHVCAKEKVADHPLFKNHCVKFGIYHAISVGFLYPGHDNTLLVCDYLGGDERDKWANFDHTKLELTTFIFTLAWLYRYGKIDQARLARYYAALSGLTEARMLNLRKYICARNQSLTAQAKDLGISKAYYQESLATIRDRVLANAGVELTKGEKTPLRILDEYYGFVEMLGDHTKELAPAKKPPFWQ